MKFYFDLYHTHKREGTANVVIVILILVFGEFIYGLCIQHQAKIFVDFGLNLHKISLCHI